MAKKKLEKIIHINYVTDDGNVYCRRKKEIAKLEDLNCLDCNMFAGTAQGQGVECMWTDYVEKDVINVTVYNPKREYEKLHKKK